VTINVRVMAHFKITDEGRKTYCSSQHVKTTVDINSRKVSCFYRVVARYTFIYVE
jgi:hypothetical protein